MDTVRHRCFPGSLYAYVIYNTNPNTVVVTLVCIMVNIFLSVFIRAVCYVCLKRIEEEECCYFLRKQSVEWIVVVVLYIRSTEIII